MKCHLSLTIIAESTEFRVDKVPSHQRSELTKIDEVPSRPIRGDQDPIRPNSGIPDLFFYSFETKLIGPVILNN